MSDDEKKAGQGFMAGAKSGMGWAVGFGTVVGVASTLRQGPSPTMKGAIKAFIRARHGAAEASERVRDLYAEAHSEYQAETGREREAHALQDSPSAEPSTGHDD